MLQMPNCFQEHGFIQVSLKILRMYAKVASTCVLRRRCVDASQIMQVSKFATIGSERRGSRSNEGVVQLLLWRIDAGAHLLLLVQLYAIDTQSLRT